MNKKRGFTLIELMVVMAIIAVLALLIIGAIQAARRTQIETANRNNAKTLQTGLEANYARNKVYCGAPSPVTCGGATFSAIAGELAPDFLSATALSDSSSADGGGQATALTASGYTLELDDYNGAVTTETITVP